MNRRRRTTLPPPATEQALGRLEEMVDALRKLAAEHDDEAAHVLEDSIQFGALLQVARLSTDRWARLIAKTAMETKDIEFDRWSA